MRRLITVALAFLVSVAVIPHAGATLGSGSFTQHHYGAPDNPYGRDYFVYEPPSRPAGLVPLVVYLHGCTQDARAAAVGSRWNELADKRGFVVAYPNQDAGKDPVDTTVRSADGSANGSQCWNWFRPESVQRDAGEPATIAGITRTVMQSENIDPRYVFVIGASAGANMSTIMAATYPDLFAGVGSLVGCPYLGCSDVTGQLAWNAMATDPHPMPAFVVDGEADELNPFVHSQNVVNEWLGVNDLADDGSMNGSVSRQPSSVEHHGLDETALSGLGTPGDVCVRNGQWPCIGGALGFQGSYPYSVFHYTNVDFWLVHGLGHDYPGGDPAGTYTDPLGPDITTGAFDFFMAHPGPHGIDFGSAPAPYATTLSSGGARHFIAGPHLGDTVAADANGPATGDEDGVTFSGPLIPGSATTVRVVSSGSGVLDAWVDLNRDGDWNDAGEEVLVDDAVEAGPNTLSLKTPVTTKGGPTYVRFRVSTDGGLSPAGFAPSGEVEDYKVDVKAVKVCKVKLRGQKC